MRVRLPSIRHTTIVASGPNRQAGHGLVYLVGYRLYNPDSHDWVTKYGTAAVERPNPDDPTWPDLEVTEHRSLMLALASFANLAGVPADTV